MRFGKDGCKIDCAVRMGGMPYTLTLTCQSQRRSPIAGTSECVVVLCDAADGWLHASWRTVGHCRVTNQVGKSWEMSRD